MLRCPNCGREYSDGANFCEACGTPLVPKSTGSYDISSQKPKENPEESFNKAVENWENNRVKSVEKQRNYYEKAGEQRSRYEQPAPGPQRGKPAQKKNSAKKNLLIAAIILVVLASVGICIWVLARPKAGNTPGSSASQGQNIPGSVFGTSDSADVSESDDKNSVDTDSKDVVTPTPTQKPVNDTKSESKVSASDITASLVSKNVVNFNDYKIVKVSSTGETSSIVQEGYNNKAEVAVDGQEVTSWQEGVAGDGIGEGVWFNLDKNYEIKYLSFKLGNWRDQKNYDENNRPSKLRIRIGDFSTSIEFPNSKEEFYVELSEAYSASVVDVHIEAVYEGTRWDDTCIAEIGIYGK